MLSELIVWLRQQGTPVTVVGGRSAGDLLSPLWSEVSLSYDPDEEPLTVSAHHLSDPDGAIRLRAEVTDFLDDLAELPPGEVRELVAAHVQATRLLVVVEFPEGGVSARGYETNGWLMSLYVEQAGGMVQCDGIGFYDQDDEIILPLG
jgi:hypothetical protein